jgi:hypothetical protein
MKIPNQILRGVKGYLPFILLTGEREDVGFLKLESRDGHHEKNQLPSIGVVACLL